jgi:transposase
LRPLTFSEHVFKRHSYLYLFMTRPAYPTDVTDAEWFILAPLLAKNRYGRPLRHSLREMVNAIYYQARTGCAWRLLPHDLPPYPAVLSRFRRWREDSIWQRVHEELRRRVRVAAGRAAEPTAAILDSQSVRTGGKRGAVTATIRASKLLVVSDIY